MIGGRSIAGIKNVIIRKKNWITGLPSTPIGLRFPAKLTIEDESIDIEKGKSVRNFVKFAFEAETIQPSYSMLKDFIEYAIDGAVEAELTSESQIGSNDGRGMKGNELFTFGATTGQPNSEFGFGFKFSEEYSSGTKKTSCTIKGNLSIEKDVADAMLATVLTDSPAFGVDVKEYENVASGNLVSIEHPSPAGLLGKADIVSYKLEIETKSGDATIYGREGVDYLSVSFEIVSHSSSVENLRTLNAIAEEGSLKIRTKGTLGDMNDEIKAFTSGSLGRGIKTEIGEKRNVVITFKGEIPIRDVSFVQDNVTEMTNTITFGD